MTEEQKKTLRALMFWFMTWKPELCLVAGIRADDAADAIRAALHVALYAEILELELKSKEPK